MSALPSYADQVISLESIVHPIVFTSAFQTQPSRQPGNLTPRTLNSLSAIAGHDGDEDDWEKEMRGLQNEEEVRCGFPCLSTVD